MPQWIERLDNVDYDSAVGMRYHGRRKAFLDVLSRLDPALSLLLGGVAFTTVVTGYSNPAAAAALTIAILSALNLAFGLGDRARLHERLQREYGVLRAELVSVDFGDEAALRRIKVMHTKIDADSPEQLNALSVLCENEEKAVRRSGTLYRVGPAQRMLANWFTLPWWEPVEDRALSG